MTVKDAARTVAGTFSSSMGRGHRHLQRRTTASVLVCVVPVLLCSCVPSARDPGTYASKAQQAAEQMISSARSAELMAKLVLSGKTTGPYASVALTQMESEASAIRSTFASIQPPDVTSQQLGEKLLGIFDGVIGKIRDMRIAARQDQTDIMAAILPSLTDDGSSLEQHAGSGS
jgi:hypothetical protein